MNANSSNTPPLLDRVTDYLPYYAERTPDLDFLLHDELRLTYAEARVWVDAYARSLLALGVRRGDRVAAYGLPRPEYLLTFLAAAGIGATWLGLNTKYTSEELEHNVTDSSPTVLFGVVPEADERLAEIAAMGQSIKHVVPLRELSDDGQIGGFAALGENVGTDELAAARATVEKFDAAAVVYTSGSTGRPRGALIPQYGLGYCAVMFNDHWRTKEQLRLLCCLPISHIGALGDLCCSAMVGGGAIYMMERFDPAGTLRAIERERLSWLVAGPAMFLSMFETAEWGTVDTSSLEHVVWWGAAAPESMILELETLGVPVSSSYGSTETVGGVIYLPGDASLEVKTNTIGRADPRVSVQVSRLDGTACEPGEEGELTVKGEFMMLGYLNRPEATAEVIRDGWLYTGDIAVEREDGNLQLVGRSKDMFKSGGYNVYCREVEIALEQHPAIELAAVVGVPDERWGEVGHAFLVSSNAPSDAELVAFAKDRLANFKVPKGFTVLDELPRLPIGKVDKVTLKQQLSKTSN